MPTTNRRQALQTLAASIALPSFTSATSALAAGGAKKPIKVGQIGVGHAPCQ